MVHVMVMVNDTFPGYASKTIFVNNINVACTVFCAISGSQSVPWNVREIFDRSLLRKE